MNINEDIYYVGDPCCVIPHELWAAKWNEPNMNVKTFNKWLEDEYGAKVYDDFGGDCCFDNIAVDSGCIAVMPMTEKLEAPDHLFFRMITGKEEAIAYAENWVKAVKGENE